MAFSRRLAISLALVTSSIAASAAANASQSTHAEVRTIVVRSVSTKVTVAKDTPPLQVFNTGDVRGSVIVGDGMTPHNTYRLIFPLAA